MFTISKTKRGGSLLIDVNFEYHLNSKSITNNKMYWLCTNREVCKARVVTNYNVADGIIVYSSSPHSHLEDQTKSLVRTINESIKQKARSEPNANPSYVIREELREIRNTEVILNISETTNLLKMVNRVQNSLRPQLPINVGNCHITTPYNNTISGDIFLRWDSGINDPNRILIFYSDTGNNNLNRVLLFKFVLGIKTLSRSSQIFADGTFDTVPKIFFQLYTIHADIFGYTFPCIYVLTLSKKKEVYEKIFDHLIDACDQSNNVLSPEIVMVDFEMAAMKAIKKKFPGTIVKGCLFHFNQSLWRRIQDYGLSGLYRDSSNTEFQQVVLSYMALPFIPEEDVFETFKQLSTSAPNLLTNFIDFYGRNYVGVVKNGKKWVKVNPKYSHETWNCYNSVISGYRRTNNVVEGWHSRFQAAIQSKHVSIWKFLEFIRKDEADNRVLIDQLFGGHRKIRHPIKKRYVINNKRITDIVKTYQEFKSHGKIKIYLHSIGRMLKNNFEYV